MSTETVNTENAQVATGERRILIYATKGGNKQEIFTDVKTWGDLKPLVKKAGFDVNKLLATESIKKNDLASDKAELPEGPFTLFMRAKETKSGSELSYKEIKAGIKAHIDADGEYAKAHYNEEKNYTTKPTDELRRLFASYVSPKMSEKPASKARAENGVAEVVETVSKAKTVVTNSDRLVTIVTLFKEIQTNTTSKDIQERIDEVLEDVLPGIQTEIDAETTSSEDKSEGTEEVAEPKESAEDQEKREAKERADQEEADKKAKEKEEAEAKARADKEESDRLDAEAKDLF